MNKVQGRHFSPMVFHIFEMWERLNPYDSRVVTFSEFVVRPADKDNLLPVASELGTFLYVITSGFIHYVATRTVFQLTDLLRVRIQNNREQKILLKDELDFVRKYAQARGTLLDLQYLNHPAAAGE